MQYNESTTIPSKKEEQLPVTGIPKGSRIAFACWSRDGKTISFTIRSGGASSLAFVVLLVKVQQ